MGAKILWLHFVPLRMTTILQNEEGADYHVGLRPPRNDVKDGSGCIFTEKATKKLRHCEGIYARGNPHPDRNGPIR